MRSSLVALLTLPVVALSSGCVRSARDRELDRVFAHQAALRDTTASVFGYIVDESSGGPVADAYVSGEYMGGGTDSTGRFEVPYLPAGQHALRVSKPGYLEQSVTVTVQPPGETHAFVRLRRASLPCCALDGRWRIRLTLDSAGRGQTPVARTAEGLVALSRTYPRYFQPRGAPDPYVTEVGGLHWVDLAPFFGTQIARDVSTTVAGTVDSLFARETDATIFNGDSVSIDFVPRISHGGLSLSGRLVGGDTLRGRWIQRAYCCGAEGRFVMIRDSMNPGSLPLPPPPRSRARDTLPDSIAGRVFVRVWDDAQQRYVSGRHAFRLARNSWISSFEHGSQPEGWGEPYKTLSGRLQVLLEEFQCGSRRIVLENEIAVPFRLRPGQDSYVTVRFNALAVKAARTYDNTQGKSCTHADLNPERDKASVSSDSGSTRAPDRGA